MGSTSERGIEIMNERWDPSGRDTKRNKERMTGGPYFQQRKIAESREETRDKGGDSRVRQC